MERARYYMNWLFRDLTERKGKYVVAEVPNPPLIIFMVAVVLSIALYPGPIQKFFSYLSFAALLYWGYQEYKGGRSRFRKLLGVLGIIAAIGAVFIF